MSGHFIVTSRTARACLAIAGLALSFLAAAEEGAGVRTAPLLPKYRQECASCHIAYPPGMLPASSWQRIVGIAPMAFGKRQHIELESPECCMVTGNRALLASLARNLIDNAIRYSPAEAHIVVTVANRSGRAALCVEDSGPGLPPSEQDRLGERFFRVVGTEQSGSGLGWSIVRRIAAVHGASVTVGRSSGLGGLRVDVIWPALEPSVSAIHQ